MAFRIYLQELYSALASGAGNLFGSEKYLLIPVQSSRKPKRNKSQHPRWDVVWFWFVLPFEYFVLEFASQDNVKQSRISQWHWFSWWRVLFTIDKLSSPHQGIYDLFHCPMKHLFAFQFYFPIFLYAYFSSTVLKVFLFFKGIFVLSRSWPLAVFPSIPLHTLFPPGILAWLPELSYWLCSFHTTFMLCSNLLCCWVVLCSYFGSRHLHPYYFLYC